MFLIKKINKDKEHKRVRLQLEREFINYDNIYSNVNNNNLIDNNQINSLPVDMQQQQQQQQQQQFSNKPIMSSSPIKSVRSRHNSYRAKSLSQENLIDLGN